MAVQFYLEVEGKRYILPVNPSEIKINRTTSNSTTEVVKLGEVNQLGLKTLADFSFSSFFPTKFTAGYVNPKCTRLTPISWVNVIDGARSGNKRVRVIATDLGINFLASVESFEWGYEDSTGDINYSIDFKEYKDYSAKYVKTVAKKVSKPKPRPKPSNNAPITPGCTVIVNGRLHRDSYGSGPGLTEKNARRKVNFIAKGRKYPYHVTMLDGGWRGWVTAGSVRRV